MQTQALVILAKVYAKHVDLKLSTVSTYAANDGKFFGSLIEGASCTLRRADIIMRWFATNWPADLEWPRDIPRPKPSKNKEAA